MTEFSRASLEGATLAGAELVYADLSHANLSGADARGAKLFRTNLHRALTDSATSLERTLALGDDPERARAEDWCSQGAEGA